MIEHIYELTNFPSISKLLKDPKFTFAEDAVRHEFTVYPKSDMEKLLNLQLLDFLNIEWNNFIYFKKNNFTGKIHTDLGDLSQVDNPCSVWGINWVFGGDCVIKYWSWNDVDFLKKQEVPGKLIQQAPVVQFNAKAPPSHVYNLYADKVYLINATPPHQAIGLNTRSVISLRSSWPTKTWLEVLEIFKKHCVKVNNEVVM